MGFYLRENDAWTKLSDDVTSREDFAFDSQNNLWFEHDGNPENLASLESEGNIQKFEDISGEIENLRLDESDQVWLVNQQDIVSTDGNNINRYPVNPNQMDVGTNGKVYYTNFVGDLFVLDNGVILENQYPQADNGFATVALAVDNTNDYLWLGNQGLDAGMTLLNLDNGNTKLINNDSLYLDYIAQLTTEIFVSKSGTIWIAARFDGQIIEVEPEIISSTQDLEDYALVFPNPCQNWIRIQADNDVQKLLIFNSFGLLDKEVNADFARKNQLDVSDISPGIYFIQADQKLDRTSFIKH